MLGSCVAAADDGSQDCTADTDDPNCARCLESTGVKEFIFNWEIMGVEDEETMRECIECNEGFELFMGECYVDECPEG